MKVARKQGLAWRKVGDEMVVIHLAQHRIFGFKGVAGQIWESLNEPLGLDAIGKIVAVDAPNGANVLDAVNRFVAELIDEDLVDIAGQMPEVESAENVVDFEVPRIEWREELQQFAGMCHLVPGQSHQCNQHPGTS